MIRFNENIESILTPTIQGIQRDHFSYLVTHRQGLNGGDVMDNLLKDCTVGEGNCVLAIFSDPQQMYTLPMPDGVRVVYEAFHLDRTHMKDYARTTVLPMLEAIHRSGYKVSAVILSGVLTSGMIEGAKTFMTHEPGMINPIHQFYRSMRQVVCQLGQTSLIVRHPLDWDRNLPPTGLEDMHWSSMVDGSRALGQEFDSELLVYKEDDDFMVVRGKLRGGSFDHTQPKPRVKL